MIRFAFGFLIVAAIAGFIAWLAGISGTVSIDIGDYRMESSLLAAFAALAIVAAVSGSLARLYGWFRTGPRRFLAARAAERHRRGLRALTQGFTAVGAGNAAIAKKMARRAEALLDEPALTLLLSAQAAQLANDDVAAQRQFQAMLERPETEFLGVRGLLAQAERAGDSERALALARRAFKTAPNSPFAVTTLVALEAKTGHWANVDSLLRARAVSSAYEPEEARKLATVAKYERAIEAEDKGLSEAALALAREAHTLSPSFIPGAVAYARVVAALGRERAARAAIRVTWRRNPHPSLVPALRAVAPSEPPDAFLRRVDKLVEFNVDHLESRIAVAEAAAAAGAADRARWALAPLAGDPSAGAIDARVCSMMTSLEEAAGASAEAAAWRTRLHAAAARIGFTCGSCDAPHDTYRSICATCGAVASLDAFAGSETVERRGLVPGFLARLFAPSATAPAATESGRSAGAQGRRVNTPSRTS